STGGTSPMADASKLYAYGVGSNAAVNGIWRELTPSAPRGAPPAREGHAMTPRGRQSGAQVREFFMFGGENVAGNNVAADLWRLQRADTTVAPDTNLYVWNKFTPSAGGPSGRTRPALAYLIDFGPLVMAGGDTTGEAQAGGL